MIIVLFGLPGAGKTFVGNLFAKKFEYFFHDCDKDLPIEMDKTIKAEGKVTTEMQDLFFKNITDSVKKLLPKQQKLVIAQTFIKEKYRREFLDAFPQAKFISIEAEQQIREERLLKRKTFKLSLSYWRRMSKRFENPQIKHFRIQNDSEGELDLTKQIKALENKLVILKQ